MARNSIERRTLVGLPLAIAIGVGAGILWPRSAARTPERSLAAETPGPQSEEAIRTTARPTPRVSVGRTSLVTTPGAPGYDAVRMVQVSGYGLGELFELEPRNEAFAAVREQDLSAAVRDAVDALSIADAVIDLEVECHTATCEIAVTTSHERMDEMSANLGLFPFGDLVTPRRESDPSDPGRALVSFVIAYSPERLSHDAFRARYGDLLTRTGLTRELSMAGVPPDGWWKGDAP